MDSSAPMLLIDPATAEIVDANPAACRYYGYTHTELKKKKITDINILTSKQIFEEMKRVKTRERRSFEFSHRLASGEIHPVEVFSGPIDLEGRVLLFSIVHDITERKQVDEALRKSEERFRQLANSTFEGILIYDKGVILDVNQALTRLTVMIMKRQSESMYSLLLHQNRRKLCHRECRTIRSRLLKYP